MASASFTRDEVILALDVLYSSENGRVTADSDEIKELSLLLNRLPIHPLENRRADFRNPHGVAVQLSKFRSNCNTGKKDPHLGSVFFDVAFEYETHGNTLANKYYGVPEFVMSDFAANTDLESGIVFDSEQARNSFNDFCSKYEVQSARGNIFVASNKR